MRTKLIIGILLAVILLGGGSYFYYYYFVKTLRLTEIVGHTDNEIVNFIVEPGDFDTGLTRHDLSSLKAKKNIGLTGLMKSKLLQTPNFSCRQMRSFCLI